jgi:hypothetical protein
MVWILRHSEIPEITIDHSPAVYDGFHWFVASEALAEGIEKWLLEMEGR